MDDNLPKNAPDDKAKLDQLEKELQELEKRAGVELGDSSQQASNQQQPQTQSSEQPTTNLPAQPIQETSPKVSNGKERGGKKIVWFAAAFVLMVLVGGAGYYLGSRAGSENKTPTPTTTPSPTPSEISTQNWKKYTQSSGWTIEYPDTWTVEEQSFQRGWWLPSEIVNFYKEGGDKTRGLWVYVYQDRDVVLRKWFEEVTYQTEQELGDSYEYQPGYYKGVKIPPTPNATVGKSEAYMFELGVPQDPSISYFVRSEDVVLEFSLPHTQTLEEKEIFEKILSSFSFVTPSPSVSPTSSPSATFSP